MKRKKLNILLQPFTYILSDSVMIFLGFLFSYWLRFNSGLIEVTKGIPPFISYLRAFILMIFVWVAVFQFFDLYSEKLKYSRIDEAYSLLIGTISATLIMMALTFWYREFTYSRIMILIAWFAIFFFLIISRFLLRWFAVLLLRRGIGVKRLVIFGLNPEAIDIKKKVIMNRNLGYEFIGFIDEDGKNHDSGGEKILGSLKDYKKIVTDEGINSIIWTIEDFNHKYLVEIMEYFEQMGCEIKIVSDIFGLITTKVQVENLDGIPTLTVKSLPLHGFNVFLKRIFDIIFSLMVITLFSIPYLIIAILIKATSKGPVFFKQERVTKDLKNFIMLKYRTMIVEAEKETGPTWTTKDDERITKVGKFLRKTSLDEMPQFFNVLKGDMSVVGPRPERPFFVEKFQKEISKYNSRHKVKCGITGWSQVNKLRGNVSIKERTKADLYYVENWSFFLDIKIILRTLFEFLFHKNA
ncbi:undecaprenyl-phosphate glucose phosphotransferase, partial [Candidatus Dependentiae bacterium]|nr:undecaprenyl-phosphate glucose phosphotransferase [Candidatus Dependentiae bacterium]